MLRSKHVVRAAALCALAACSSDAGNPLDPTTTGPAYAISDAAHAGAVTGFYFLPPLVKQPAYSGTFDAAVSPRVSVCELAGSACGTTIAQWTTSTGVTVSVAAEAYQVNWHTDEYALDPARHYRITVDVDGFVLGFADVDVVASGKELKNVDTNEYIALVDGRTLPIKFRIETGIAAVVDVDPDSASIAPGETQAFTATVFDLHGDPIAAPVTWASSDDAIATIDAGGVASGVAEGTVTITATSGGASGTAVLVVVNPNTPPVANDIAFDAIGNVTVPVSAPGVLANDTDPENDPLSAVPGTFATAAGGTVTVNADGSFAYLSAPGFTGTDSFQYQASDGSLTSDPATVTMEVPTRVWYADNAAAPPGDGRDASPFATLKAAESAAAAGETVFVLAGDGTSAGYDEGFVFKSAQTLTGQGISSDVTVMLNGESVVLLAAGAAPSLTRTDAGATLVLAQDNTIQGVQVASTAGAGIAGSGFAMLTAGSVSVAAAGGPSLDLSSGTAAAAFAELSSAGSAGAGLRLLDVGGVLSAPTGSIVGAAGTAVDVTGGNANVTYGGNVASVGPRPVSVTARTGGTLTLSGPIASTGQGILVQGNGGGTIAFTGASKSLSTGAGHGVDLASNSGAIVQFAGGGLAVATTTGEAFRATGGGAVTVTGAANTLNAAGGVALRVENATIGSAGLSFRSVSATGGPNGIVLVNTGALNGMQVTGTGAAGSGGTIQGASGDGVRLVNARNVILTSMSIQNNAGSGIAGQDVTGFTLDGSSVLNNGDDAAASEAGVRFDNLLGTAVIDGSTVSGSVEDNVRVMNTSGTLSLSVSSSSFGANSTTDGRDGLFVEGSGSAVVNLAVQSSQFTGARANLLRLSLQGSAQSTLMLASNTFANTHPAILPGAGGVAVESVSGSATLDYSITGNSFSGASGTALGIQESVGTGTLSGTISGNVIGMTGIANSGSAQGSGLSLTSVGGGSHTVAVTNNQIRQYNNQGILLQIGDATFGGNGTLNATITGNTVAEPGTAPTFKNGIHLNAGLTTGDNPQVCLDLGGAGALANEITGAGSGGAAGTDFRLRQRFLTTVRLPGYAGANDDNAAVTTFVQSRNGGTPTGLTQNTVSTGGGGYVGGAACPQP